MGQQSQEEEVKGTRSPLPRLCDGQFIMNLLSDCGRTQQTIGKLAEGDFVAWDLLCMTLSSQEEAAAGLSSRRFFWHRTDKAKCLRELDGQQE